MKAPLYVRKSLRRQFPWWDRDLRGGRGLNPFANAPDEWKGHQEGICLGVVEEPFHHHWPYIAACRELGISYRVVRITDTDWSARVRESGCDAFLVWPSMGRRSLRVLFDDRLRIMEQEMDLRLYPRYGETWFYENKYRLADWLETMGIPHPETHRFQRREDALAYAEKAALPLVVKTGLGASASGVWVLRSRAKLRRWIRRAFRSGLLADFRHVSEAEAGSILLQSYVRIAREWRMVRVGDSYFGHVKGNRGGFHSGSGRVEWDEPTPRHLEFLREVCEKGGLRSMAVDVFETDAGELLVNELQTVFSARTSVDQTRVGGQAGRYVRRAVGSWHFEAGDFARNACCNLRVQDLLNLLAEERAGV